MNKEEIKNHYNPDSKWFGRNLNNYKDQQEKVAKSKNCLAELLKAKTLTEARKILYGIKRGAEKKTKKKVK